MVSAKGYIHENYIGSNFGYPEVPQSITELAKVRNPPGPKGIIENEHFAQSISALRFKVGTTVIGSPNFYLLNSLPPCMENDCS